MNRPVRYTAVIGAILGSLPVLTGCRFVGKNYSLVSDTVRAPQADQVAIENASGGLPAIASSTGGTPPPGGAPLHPLADGGQGVTVQKGDTLSSIARRHGVSVAELCRANGLTSTSVIRVGQKLSLPTAGKRNTPVATTSSARTHKVQPGETLGSIAARHHTTVAKILQANGMRADQANRIRAGQVLRLPTTSR